MLVNVGAEERDEMRFSITHGRWRQSYLQLFTGRGLLFALNKGYQGLHTRDEAKLVQGAEDRLIRKSRCPGQVLVHEDYHRHRERGPKPLSLCVSAVLKSPVCCCWCDHWLCDVGAHLETGSVR